MYWCVFFFGFGVGGVATGGCVGVVAFGVGVSVEAGAGYYDVIVVVLVLLVSVLVLPLMGVLVLMFGVGPVADVFVLAFVGVVVDVGDGDGVDFRGVDRTVGSLILFTRVLVGVQVDNPCAVLDQENSKKFLQGSEKDKYAFFMKATDLDRVLTVSQT